MKHPSLFVSPPRGVSLGYLALLALVFVFGCTSPTSEDDPVRYQVTITVPEQASRLVFPPRFVGEWVDGIPGHFGTAWAISKSNAIQYYNPGNTEIKNLQSEIAEMDGDGIVRIDVAVDDSNLTITTFYDYPEQKDQAITTETFRLSGGGVRLDYTLYNDGHFYSSVSLYRF